MSVTIPFKNSKCDFHARLEFSPQGLISSPVYRGKNLEHTFWEFNKVVSTYLVNVYLLYRRQNWKHKFRLNKVPNYSLSAVGMSMYAQYIH